MNICWSRLGGMLLSIVICFLTTVACQDEKWTGYYNQPHSPTLKWATTNSNDQFTTVEDLQLQSSIRRQSFSKSFGKMNWKNPQSKPQWQTPMYKPKWQDPYSKPQWQVSKVHHLKPFTKRPFKNINVLDKQPRDQWNIPKEWQGRSRPKVNNEMWGPARLSPVPIPTQGRVWPEYIPPLSIIKPSMDDPHGLYTF